MKILPEEDWEAFYNMLKEPLDICFRINSIHKHWTRTKKLMEEKIDKILADPTMEKRTPQKVKWYPN